MKTRIKEVKSKSVDVYPDRRNQPDYYMLQNKIHALLTCKPDELLRIRIGEPSLKSDSGENLLPRDNFNRTRKYPFVLTNASELDYFFEYKEYDLSDGSIFVVHIAEREYVEIERYTFVLQNKKWALSNVEKIPCSSNLRKLLYW